VSANELIRDSTGDLFYIKRIGLIIFGNPGVKVDLKKEVAEFFSDCRPVVLLNCLYELITLFKQILEKRGVSLLGIPRTAPG
jgi:hypothetical protein